MVIDVNRNTEIQFRESFEGKNKRILKIRCNECPETERSARNSMKCVSCLLKTLYHYKNHKFELISIESFDRLIDYNKVKFILEYFKKLKSIRKIFRQIENLKAKKCNYKDFKCRIFPDFQKFFKIKENTYYNPVLMYTIVQEKLKLIKSKGSNDNICQNCYNYIINSFNFIYRILSNINFLSDFENFEETDDLFKRMSNFYQSQLFGNYFFIEHKRSSKLLKNRQNEEIIDVYEIGEFKLFQISIYDVINENEKKYEGKLSFKSSSDEIYFKKIIKTVLKHLDIFKLERIISLEKLIDIYKKESDKILVSKFNVPEDERQKIGFFTALKKLNLLKLFPLLIDDYIEEIFLDSPSTEIYINHQKHGRCRTEIHLSSKEIERIKTLMRLYSKQRLDYMNPSIKFVIKNKYFYCRFSIDIEPVHINKFALDIRKLNKNILTIQDLLKNETLSIQMAAFLYFNILRRINLTVTGETDTGKTTLINAFDLLTPKEFRKIYVENIEESLNQTIFDKHQLKYQADSLDDTIKKYSKSSYIKILLHRTPDIIFLGEILTKEESEAMFHCLAAGLRGFQTIHSNTIESLINRFLYHFKINSSCLNDLDLIILMKKSQNQRKIILIAEIDFHQEDLENYYNIIFQYNPESEDWDKLRSLYETNTINKLKKYEDINKEKFHHIMSLYKDIFNVLKKIEKVKNEHLVDLFHKISFLSFNSVPLLENFWEKWKKNRGLN